MKNSGTNPRHGWLIRNFWLLTLMLNLALLLGVFVVLILLYS